MKYKRSRTEGVDWVLVTAGAIFITILVVTGIAADSKEHTIQVCIQQGGSPVADSGHLRECKR